MKNGFKTLLLAVVAVCAFLALATVNTNFAGTAAQRYERFRGALQMGAAWSALAVIGSVIALRIERRPSRLIAWLALVASFITIAEILSRWTYAFN